MLNNEQYNEKKEKVQTVVELFLSGKKMIRDISEETGISKSSVQRYLNDIEFINGIYGDNASFIIEEIQRKLVENKEEGNKLGGDTFASNYESLKDEVGHFTGVRRR